MIAILATPGIMLLAVGSEPVITTAAGTGVAGDTRRRRTCGRSSAQSAV